MIAVAAVALAIALSGSDTPGTATPSVYVSANGEDSNPGTESAPVASFARAYSLARPGQIVEVGAGEYGYQRLARDPSKSSSAMVVFRPAPGASVKLSTLDFGQAQFDVLGPRYVTVRDMSIDYLRAWAGSRDLRWLDIDGKHFDVFDARDVVIRGGDYGPCEAPRDDDACVSRIAGRSAGITVDGVTIHDITSTDLANHHVDGLFIRGSTNVVIRNSKFLRNMITNIRVQDQQCCKNTDLLIENNWFASPLQGDGVSPRYDAIDVDTNVPGLVIRNNSFLDSGLQLLGTFTRARVVGNLMGNAGCARGVRYSRNLFIPFGPWIGRRPCGRTDRRVRSFGYVDPAGFDLRLSASSPAFAAGDPDDCAATDIERMPRLRGLKCDAGAYERQEAWICHRRKVGSQTRATSLLVALATVRARLRTGDTIGRCRSG